MEKLRKRFEVIGRGAADCDGYTSNTEEATFIVSKCGFIDNKYIGYFIG